MRVVAICVVGMSLIGCQKPRIRDVIQELHSSAYSQRLQIRNHVIEARYVPPTLQALERADLDGSRILTRHLLDSLEHSISANPGISFLLTLAPSDTSTSRGLTNDVIYGASTGYSDYHEAMRAYQFGLKEKIWIEAGGKKYPLASYTMENSWGLTRSRNFFLVFRLPDDIRTGSVTEFQLVLDDIVPGLARRKIKWTLPIGEYDALI